jgi:hypothetical protein
MYLLKRETHGSRQLFLTYCQHGTPLSQTRRDMLINSAKRFAAPSHRCPSFDEELTGFSPQSPSSLSASAAKRLSSLGCFKVMRQYPDSSH